MQHLWRLFNRFSLSYLWLPEKSQLNIHYTIRRSWIGFFYKKSFWVWPNISTPKFWFLVCIHRKCLLIHFSKLLDSVWMLRKVFIFLNFLMRKLFKMLIKLWHSICLFGNLALHVMSGKLQLSKRHKKVISIKISFRLSRYQFEVSHCWKAETRKCVKCWRAAWRSVREGK